MFKLACPGCGAEVVFRSATSALAVCQYCRSTLLRDADAVRDVGKMAVALEDYSPIRITTSGMYAGKAFGVVGRIQLRYAAGFWNEWYLLFDDGSAGWLSDASGQYAVTVDTGIASDAPPFGQIVPGGFYPFEGVTYSAADLRTAQCSGGEGELPFLVGAGWQARVADYRQSHRFLTLDYSDGDTPCRFVGKAVSLADLKCQLLREPADIARSAGHLKGKAAVLDCPACGASISWRPAVAAHLHCPACGTESDATTGTAEIMDAARREALVHTTLALGDVAKIDGAAYSLIGLMRCREVGEVGGMDEWTEYLLFNEAAGFVWLVESGTGWDKVKVLDAWPESVSASAVSLEGSAFTRMQAYGAEVIYAAGAFNWRVKVGDTVSITDYRGARGTLSCERSPAEISWSLAQRVPAGTVDGWFGKKGKLAAAAAAAGNTAVLGDSLPAGALNALALRFTAILLVINVPLSFMGGFINWLITLIAIGVLWWPIYSRITDDAP